MTIARTLLTVAVLIPILAGCASGPKYGDMAGTLPPLDPAKGRIFFYRPSALGTAVQPDVRLNGEKVGTAKPHGVYFVDRDPGNYDVATSTEVEKKLTMTLDKGDIRFVRLNVQMGVLVYRIYPDLVEQAKAMEEIRDLHYIARPLGN